MGRLMEHWEMTLKKHKTLKPHGHYVSRLASLGWEASIDLRDGLEQTYASFLQELSGEDGATLREQ